MPATPLRLDIKILGVQRVQRQLFRGMAVIGDMRDPLNDVADDIMYVVGKNFSSQGRRGGGSWQRLSADRVRQKAKKGLEPEILIATGALHDSMTQRGDRDQYLRVTKSSLTLGSKLARAKVHDEGLGHMPKRQFTKFITSDRQRWVDICEQAIMDAMRKG